MVRPILLLSLLLTTAAGAATIEPRELRTRLVPERAKVGEPVTLEILITHPKDQRYELKTPTDLGDFNALGQERKRVDGASSSTTTINVKLAAFQLGLLETPPLELEVTGPEGSSTTLRVPPAKLQVDSTLPDEAQSQGENLYDTHPPEEVPIRSWRLVYALLAVLALAALGYALSRYLSRPKTVAAPPPVPAEPLHVRTTKALDALANEHLPAKGEFKPYYFRLSEIMRGYLGELYGFEALESTTPELLQALSSRSTPGLPMAEVAAFAEASDFVRYAKQVPTLEECKAHLELGYRVISSTQAARASLLPPVSS